MSNNVTKIVITADGGLTGVYDDQLHRLFKAVGTPLVERASSVEFDPMAEEWVARFLKTGETIAHGPNREQVIRDEVRWIEAHGLHR